MALPGSSRFCFIFMFFPPWHHKYETLWLRATKCFSLAYVVCTSACVRVCMCVCNSKQVRHSSTTPLCCRDTDELRFFLISAPLDLTPPHHSAWTEARRLMECFELSWNFISLGQYAAGRTTHSAGKKLKIKHRGYTSDTWWNPARHCFA